MIPKIIHFCWLSNDAYPEKIQYCIDTWKKILPDYEIRLWNFDRFPRGKSAWVDQAFDSRKYAFAADYIRAYALYHEGGIYLDSDVEVLKNFDAFLNLPYMLGSESDSGDIEAAVIGAEKGFEPFKMLLDYYDNRSFKKADGTFDTVALPNVMNALFFKKYRKLPIGNISEFDYSADTLSIFPADYFSPIHIINLKKEVTENTVAIHHFAGTWISPYKRWKKNLQRKIGPALTMRIIIFKSKLKKALGLKR